MITKRMPKTTYRIEDAVFQADNQVYLGSETVHHVSLSHKKLEGVVLFFAAILIIRTLAFLYMNFEDIDTIKMTYVFSVLFLTVTGTFLISIFITKHKTLLVFEKGFFTGNISLTNFLKGVTIIYPWFAVESINVTVPFEEFEKHPNIYLTGTKMSKRIFISIKGKGFKHIIHTSQLLQCLAVLSKWAPNKLTENAWEYIDRTQIRPVDRKDVIKVRKPKLN